jgi:hypothetical protein
MANLINKSQVTVIPTASSVSYAVLDQGGNLDSNFNAVVRAVKYLLALIFNKLINYLMLLQFLFPFRSWPMGPRHTHGLSQVSPTM